MFRKFALGLLAAASIGATALLPTAASAHSLHLGWGWGWGPGYSLVSPTYYMTTPAVTYDGCLQRQFVQTRHGMRVRTVNVCF